MTNLINNFPTYHSYPIQEFQGNPLIEALHPPPHDRDAAILSLIKRPTFDISERELPSAIRMFFPARLTRFLFPTTQHVQILKHVYCQILDGYRFRNPLTVGGQHFLHNAGNPEFHLDRGIESASSRPSTISFLTGLSGMGKSTLIRGVMGVIGNPVIQHSNFRGIPFTDSQILYLMRNVPDQCGPKALAKTYGDYTDTLLNTNLYGKLFADKSMTRTHYVAELRRIVANHHVGAIVLDEFQNLSLAGTDGKRELIALLINMRDELGVPIILVGTYKAVDMLEGEASIARRLVEGGFHDLKRPESPANEDWRALCETVWEYQWVRNPIDLDDNIISVLYEYSQGITGIMLNLFVAAQVEAIDSESERVDNNLLQKVYLNRLKPLHNIINALRSNDIKFLSRYDDLYIKGFNELKNDNFMNQIESIRVQLTADHDNQLGMFTPVNQEKKQNILDRPMESKLSTEELLVKVMEDSTTFPEALS